MGVVQVHVSRGTDIVDRVVYEFYSDATVGIVDMCKSIYKYLFCVF